ncbi:hypothetical protein [Halopenitus persicus]|uniref:hypothetical protein n=1 Tax=Halopenitus persicus TaxID=1048396 RepID=UPI000BBB3DD2|nr:hypothetical protein [Halopenitus persicus]
MSEMKSVTEIDSKAEMVERMGEMDADSLYVLEDAVEAAEPWGEEAVERVRDRAQTFLQKGAMPYGDNDMEDEAVGVYEVAQAAIRAEGGEPLSGSGAGSGFYARSAYKRNMKRLAEITDGVEFDDLDVQEPSKMEE